MNKPSRDFKSTPNVVPLPVSTRTQTGSDRDASAVEIISQIKRTLSSLLDFSIACLRRNTFLLFDYENTFSVSCWDVMRPASVSHFQAIYICVLRDLISLNMRMAQVHYVNWLNHIKTIHIQHIYCNYIYQIYIISKNETPIYVLIQFS